MKEICICAAIQLEDGRIIRGHRHDDCLQLALRWQQAGQNVGNLHKAEQGFMTSNNRFVDRLVAMRLQKAAKQKSARTFQLFSDRVKWLFSEDLY